MLRAELEYIHTGAPQRRPYQLKRSPFGSFCCLGGYGQRHHPNEDGKEEKKLVSLVIFIHLPPYMLGAKYWMTSHIAWGGEKKNPTRILLCAVGLLEGLD
jgi:hypothetical protein